MEKINNKNSKRPWDKVITKYNNLDNTSCHFCHVL